MCKTEEDEGPSTEEGSQSFHGAGMCKWFNVRMGFGFLSMTSREGVPLDEPVDVFVHQVGFVWSTFNNLNCHSEEGKWFYPRAIYRFSLIETCVNHEECREMGWKWRGFLPRRELYPPPGCTAWWVFLPLGSTCCSQSCHPRGFSCESVWVSFIVFLFVSDCLGFHPNFGQTI